jgi:hypothetical protein
MLEFRGPNERLIVERLIHATRGCTLALAMAAVAPGALATRAQDPRQIVQQAVDTELAASAADKTHWLFYEVDQKPGDDVKQWVAQTDDGDLVRLLEKNGAAVSADEERNRIKAFEQDPSQQARQHKNNQHDDKQAAEMLNMLPHAFVWTRIGNEGGNTTLHFKPDPQFDPPDYEARVFAAMEGDMTVNDAEHRIVSLKGKLIRDVKFGFGVLGELKAGGTFDVERRQTGGGEWQITESHIHIAGHALLFKSIGAQEDDVKTRFKRLPDGVTFEEAEKELMGQNAEQ